MFERFTTDARQSVLAAANLAAESGAAKAEPDHLLLALSRGGGAGADILTRHGVSADDLTVAARGPRLRAGLTDDEAAALGEVGIDVEQVFRRIEQTFGPDALDQPATARPPRRPGRVGGPYSPQAKKVLELSLREARALGAREIGSPHLLLALLRQGVSAPLAAVLDGHEVTYNTVRRAVG
ncbi:Clp protease N-terminal domain-containing protein [Nonomuraea typhae]|uniref:Clp protease N-terminal domain-containing protein n=1 Tax=Nonomuraea typhae TaxID=2603600 RepID=UPI0012F78DF8|nr:Clp protease N-terminal domain-containing protein [Nonomuraea typhae]